MDERTNAALNCRLFYDTCRRAVLSDHEWSFCNQYETLALSGTAPGHWEYCYAYPADTVRVRFLFDENFDPQRDSRVPFKIAVAPDKSGKQVWTNLEEAQAAITLNIENPNLFDAQFILALSYKLAHEIALPMTRDKSKKREMYQYYMQALPQAAVSDMNEGEEITDVWDASWIAARA